MMIKVTSNTVWVISLPDAFQVQFEEKIDFAPEQLCKPLEPECPTNHSNKYIYALSQVTINPSNQSGKLFFHRKHTSISEPLGKQFVDSPTDHS